MPWAEDEEEEVEAMFANTQKKNPSELIEVCNKYGI